MELESMVGPLAGANGGQECVHLVAHIAYFVVRRDGGLVTRRRIMSTLQHYFCILILNNFLKKRREYTRIWDMFLVSE